MALKERILAVREEHPDWSKGRIAREVGCSHTAVRYHLDPEARRWIIDATLRWQKENRERHNANALAYYHRKKQRQAENA